MSLTGRRLTLLVEGAAKLQQAAPQRDVVGYHVGPSDRTKEIASKPARMCPEPHPLAGGHQRFDRLAGGGESAAEMTVARQSRSVPSEAGSVQKYCTTVQF
jgi:hypothetical protein